MFINKISHYLPEAIVTNEYFEKLNGLSNEWIIERTGIQQRRKAADNENTNTMAIAAVEKLFADGEFKKSDVDLIVGATYTPFDTIVTLAHAVQHFIDVSDIPVVSISSACSSLINAFEIVEGYFAMGKSKNALIVVSEHNTIYNNEKDTIAGHLWGDGSAAFLVSKEKRSENAFSVKDILTGGAATSGKATEAVVLQPAINNFKMPHGRDVFMNACFYMPKATNDLLEKHNLSVSQINYIIPHQANLRITKNVANTLELREDQAISNVEYLGNTGSAGCGIALSENLEKFKRGDKIVLTVFGGGYSYGAMLLEK
jgi:3-oxoacyl-[acyl-carrier-protein] synthase III